MKEKYIPVKIEVIHLEDTDIIVTSEFDLNETSSEN